nr:ANTAR domain-containing protein [Pseudarthrobacter sp. NS4]
MRHDDAFRLLAKASSNRNQKLHHVAADIIARLGVTPDQPLRFDD